MPDADYERSGYEACLDLDYSIRSSEIHYKFYGRVRWAIAFIQTFAASAAAAPLVGVNGPPWLVSAAGFLLASITIIDVLSDFSGSRHEHGAQCKKYRALRASYLGDDWQALDRERLRLAENVSTIRALELVAYNDVVLRHGRMSHVVPLTALQRLFEAVV